LAGATTAMTDLLFIHNWDKWQTYRRDRPQGPWIKAHRSLLQDRKWIHLTDEQRGQLFSIWLLAANDGGSIPNDPAYIKLVCCLRSEPDLNLFIERGFLDNQVAPLRRQLDALEESREELEIEKREKGADAPTFAKEFNKSFWPKYPHKTGKPKALAAYLKARTKATLEEILAGLDRYILSKPVDRPWLNPATFLNQERWLDQPAEVASGGARRNGSGWYIKPDTAEWDAWAKYGRKHCVGDIIYGMKIAEEKGTEFHVKDRWPPR